MWLVKTEEQITFDLEKDLYDRIERERGLVPRATFVRELLRKAIDKGLRPD